jgi:hypothetical protein
MSVAGFCAELLRTEKESIIKSDPMSVVLLKIIRQMCCVNFYLQQEKKKETKL